MRSTLSVLEVLRPKSLDQALAAMAVAEDERPIPMAGGTDLFVYLNAGTQSGRRFMDLQPLRELSKIEVRRDAIRLGALVTFQEIRSHEAIRKSLPSLAAAAAEIGGLQIQHRATVGGNIANASPAGDSLPVLLAHDATVIVRSRRGEREVPFDELYIGYRKLAIQPDELIVAVTVPIPDRGAFPFFRKVGTRRAQSISKVVFCGLLETEKSGRVMLARLAFGSMAPVPLLAAGAEARLIGAMPSSRTASEARAALAGDLSPIDDIRSDRDYRLTVAGNVLEQFLRAADARFARA